MAKKKTGTQADNVFKAPQNAEKLAKSKAADTPAESKPRGRPPLSEGYSKTSLSLRGSQIAWLDEIGIAVRRNTGVYIARAELIAGVIEFAERSGTDFSKATSAEEVTRLLLARLKTS